ncbi:MAG: hypothetical protein FD135_1416 [Comamonadaceae bacterium]|nr:MAG: hypothetical protein FD135_1416 [Comamonadaceae bacterium]
MKLGADPTTGIRMWESYLQLYRIPFARITSASDIDKATTTGVLILPSTVVMSEAEKQAVQHWRDRGGSVLSTWLTAAYSPTGEPAGYAFMKDVLDVEVKGNTQTEVDDTYMIMHGDTPVSHTLPAGMRVWLERVPHQLPLRLVGKQEAAHVMSWARNFDAQKPAGLMAFNERQMPSGLFSRTVTMGYPEQNWLRSDPRQISAVTHDILAWLFREPKAYIGAWPYPYQSAMLLALQAAEPVGQTEIGIGANYRKMGGLATYYVLGSNIAKALPSVKKIMEQGHEIGFYGDQFEAFSKQPEATQAQRLESMQAQLAQADIKITTPASFATPMDGYDDTTRRLLAAQNFGNYLSFMELNESSLPFIASRSAEGLPQTVVLPRTLAGPEEAAEQDPEEGLTNFLGALALNTRMGGMSVVRLPSENLLSPEQRKEMFDSMASQREQMWMASAKQISNWWRQREGVSVEFEPHSQGYALTTTVAQAFTASESISIWVNLPRPNTKVILQAQQKTDKVPEVVIKDKWRAAIVFKNPPAGKQTWLVRFEDSPTPNGK